MEHAKFSGRRSVAGRAKESEKAVAAARQLHSVKEKKRGETGRMTSVAELQLQCDRFAAVPDVEADVRVGVRDLSLSLSFPALNTRRVDPCHGGFQPV